MPIDFALDDNNKQVGNASAAIEAAVKLHKASGILVLDTAQEAGLQTHVASMSGNFVAHFATGSTSAFSSASATESVSLISFGRKRSQLAD